MNMITYPTFSAENNIDLQADCFVQFLLSSDVPYYPHFHDYFEIFIIAKGSIRHMVNGIIQDLPEGSLVFIRPGDLHSHMHNDSNSQEDAFINLTFTRETADKLLNYLFDKPQADNLLYAKMPPTVLLDKLNKNKLIFLINELKTENFEDKEKLKLRMRVILANIFGHFTNSVFYEQKETVPEWLFEITEQMSKPENFILGIQRMIDLSGKSREHLSRTFKKYHGITITDFINNLRVNHASKLLINTDVSVIDICFECGFQNLGYFYKVFKNKTATTPCAFRDKYKINT